jgi:hypothetical protein
VGCKDDLENKRVIYYISTFNTANPVYSQAGPGAPLHRWAAKMTVNKRVTFYLGISYSKSCVLTGRAGGATAQVGCNDDEVNKRVM